MQTIIHPNNVLEIVLYTIKEDQQSQYLSHRQTMVNELSGWEGFIKGITYRSVESPLLYADLFLWGSLEEAKSAAARIHETPQCAAFMQCIDNIKLYDHSTVTNDSPLPEAFDKQILEIAAFTAPEEKHTPLAAARTPLFSEVQELDGQVSISSFHSQDNKELFIDLLVWRDEQALKTAQQQIHSSDSCAMFMGMIEENIAFEQMQRVA